VLFRSGETAHVFAGPFAASHHKSSLLIAGMFSFYNAGSGTNQSNHKYKLGALHQGVLARGVKTGSSSYLMWPTHVGPFSVVIGKHASSFDSSELPFSLILERDGRDVIWPAMVLIGCGLWRDGMKWRGRERRHAGFKRDIVDAEVLSPYTVGAVLRAITLLGTMSEKPRLHGGYVVHKGVALKQDSLSTYARYYGLAVDIYTGQQLCKRLRGASLDSNEALRRCLAVDDTTGRCDWVDVGGMLVPAHGLNSVLNDVRTGALDTLELLAEALVALHEQKPRHAWQWCTDIIEQRYDITPDTATPQELERILAAYRSALGDILGVVEFDAAKEFDDAAMVGYGIGGDEAVRMADFQAVRGTMESNAVLGELRKTFQHAMREAEAAVERLRALPDVA
jgi:hypothetical protein